VWRPFGDGAGEAGPDREAIGLPQSRPGGPSIFFEGEFPTLASSAGRPGARHGVSGGTGSVRHTLGLVIAVMLLIGGVSVATTFEALHAQRYAAVQGESIRLLRARIHGLVHRVGVAAVDAPASHARVDMGAEAEAIESLLRVLVDGGEVDTGNGEVKLPPAVDPSFRDALDEVVHAWAPMREAMDAALEAPPGSAEQARLAAALQRHVDAVGGAVDEAARVLERSIEARRRRLSRFQLGFLLVGGVTVATAYVLLRTQIATPVDQLGAAVRRIEYGDLGAEIRIPVDNELGRLGAMIDRMRERIRSRVDDHLLLASLSRTLLGLTDPGAVAAATIAAVRDRFRPDAIGFYAPSSDGRRLERVGAYGWRGETERWRIVQLDPPSSSEIAWAVQLGAAVQVDHTAVRHPFRTPPEAREAGISAALVLPVGSAGDGGDEVPIGVLIVESRVPRRFDSDEVELLTLITRYAALAIARAREHHALRISEAKFSGLVSIAADAIISIDAKQRITLFNEGAERIFGYSSEEVLGRPLDVLLPERFRARHRELVERFGAGPVAARRMGERREIYGLRKGGEEFPAEASISRLEIEGERIYAVVLRDITDRQRIEEEIRRSRHLAAVATLTGGIAHHFNNALTAIQGHVDLLLAEAAPGEGSSGDLEEIRRSAERAAALTRQLLAFSRMQLRRPEVVEVNAIAREAEPRLREVAGDAVALRLSLSDSPAHVRADPSEVREVLVHLVSNARDALPAGGTITIEMRVDDEAGDGAGGETVGGSGRCMTLIVRDDGHGMDADTLGRSFEPFFTTKDPARSVGLGLSVVYGFVTQAGGAIDVRSEPGRGTEVKIRLPLVEPPAEVALSATGSDRRGRAPGPVLLVEDEAAVRALVRKILRRCGFVVLEAASGPEALALVERHRGNPIDLVVSDVVMPGMSGPDMMAALRAAGLAVPVLYISGYSPQEIEWAIASAPGVAFLQKPFTPEALIDKLRELIGGPPIPAASH